MQSGLQYHHLGFSGYIHRKYQLQLLERHGSLRYHQRRQVLVSGSVGHLLDRLGRLPAWSVYRIATGEMVAKSDEAVAHVTAHLRGSSVACSIEMWATDADVGQALQRELMDGLGAPTAPLKCVTIDWFYHDGRSFHSVPMHEQIDEVIQEAAYPWLPDGLHRFTKHFLRADESVVVFFGTPGVGKTRLIRHLLAAMSEQRGEAARVLYTADARAMASDEFFVRFMTEDYDAMVIEDADHLLSPRADGNHNLHRLLAASDGLLHSRGRRLIFSTNLPSKLDIDEALIRPGRCFGSFAGRKLSDMEVVRVMSDLSLDAEHRSRVVQELGRSRQEKFALAEVYSAVRQTQSRSDGQELPKAA